MAVWDSASRDDGHWILKLHSEIDGKSAYLIPFTSSCGCGLPSSELAHFRARTFDIRMLLKRYTPIGEGSVVGFGLEVTSYCDG
jgi:hypothetical protein